MTRHAAFKVHRQSSRELQEAEDQQGSELCRARPAEITVNIRRRANRYESMWRCLPVIPMGVHQLPGGEPSQTPLGSSASDPVPEEIMAALIDAIDVKRKMFFEVENTPFVCLEAEVSTPTARGAQTLVRLKMRNLLTRAVFDKTFKASDRFKEPDLQMVEASYLYSDGDGFHFMDQESFETLTLSREWWGTLRTLSWKDPSFSCISTTATPSGCSYRPTWS